MSKLSKKELKGITNMLANSENMLLLIDKGENTQVVMRGKSALVLFNAYIADEDIKNIVNEVIAFKLQ